MPLFSTEGIFFREQSYVLFEFRGLCDWHINNIRFVKRFPCTKMKLLKCRTRQSHLSPVIQFCRYLVELSRINRVPWTSPHTSPYLVYLEACILTKSRWNKSVQLLRPQKAQRFCLIFP